MAKIKIISNPYMQEIHYQVLKGSDSDWADVTIDSNPNSKLISDKFSKSFFPFVVREIVDEIVKEYSDNNGKLELVFEGTEDEYKDLEMVCEEGDLADRIVVSPSDKYLENARDILADIIDIFKSVNPLISQNIRDAETIERDLLRFSEASNDVIPICVLGNYSSGKSTFINSLIGAEILPNGDEPVTAKIYKIERSTHSDRAHIKFDYNEKTVNIRFTDDNYRFSIGDSEEELIVKIKEVLNKEKDQSITRRISAALSIINSFDGKDSEDTISDLIELSVPFIGGIWNQIDNKIVIFDTPGSNSASNDKHLKVLKVALEGFSNGLPIYISEYNALDTTDNEKLYKEIKSMAELDSRFTMIIVNKADSADLPKNNFTESDIERILNETIPKNLYSEGIFFVSSILGLGSKTKGEFVEDHYAEIYEEKQSKYTDADSRFYKTLYKYDIMPEQLKKKLEASAKSCSDLLYANSGLYSVEEEISTFAKKYSSYNKCQQSQMFLRKLIAMTSKEIDRITEEREKAKRDRSVVLERDKIELINALEKKEKEVKEICVEYYPKEMSPVVDSIIKTDMGKDLEQLEEALLSQQKAQHSIDIKDKEVKDSADTLKGNLGANIIAAIKEKSIDSIKNIGADLISDMKEIQEDNKNLKTAKEQVDIDATNELIKKINEQYLAFMLETRVLLDEKSKAYWEEATGSIKKELIEVVSGTESLSDEEKTTLSDIIIKYDEIIFEDSDNIFEKKNFEHSLLKKLFGNKNRLNIKKLKKRYNEKIDEEVNNTYYLIESSHKNSLEIWSSNLLMKIEENIVDFNPSLHRQNEIIKEEEAKIIELENKKRKLNQHNNEITKMMDWKYN